MMSVTYVVQYQYRGQRQRTRVEYTSLSAAVAHWFILHESATSQASAIVFHGLEAEYGGRLH